jgi:hypothetical protein
LISALKIHASAGVIDTSMPNRALSFANADRLPYFLSILLSVYNNSENAIAGKSAPSIPSLELPGFDVMFVTSSAKSL